MTNKSFNIDTQLGLSGDPMSPKNLINHVYGIWKDYYKDSPYGKFIDYCRNHLGELKELYKEIVVLHKSENLKMDEEK